MKLFLVSVSAAIALTSSAFAADYASTYKLAVENFDKRGDNEFAQTCANLAGEAATLATNDTEKYDALVLQSRCTYFVGMKAKKDDDKVRVFGDAKNFADRAKGLQKDRAEAYYYYGISLGRWAEANGIMKSLGERHNLRRTMETVLTKTAIEDGKTVPGREIDGWGANRTLGRMYFKLPGMFGGDNRRAEALLREAVEKQSPSYLNSLNTQYLAEVLIANGKKAEARKVLDDVLQYENDPAKYNPKRVPETVDEMREIRALRNQLGN